MEDEWERGMDADEFLDLLFVKFRTEQITVEEMQKTVKDLGFHAELKKLE